MEEVIKKYEKVCWKAVIGKRKTVSHFGGNPLLQGEWPLCGVCSERMALFVQLDVGSLPMGHPIEGSGILQVFYCTGCDEAFEPFAKCQLVRLVGGGKEPSGKPMFEAKYIARWEPLPDYPQTQELRLGSERLDRLDDFLETNEAFRTKAGDKLGGWPYWIQGVEQPKCPKCKKKMAYIFQIDSDDNLDWMFGDIGCGHVFQCEEHRDVLSFHWACG